MDEDRRFRLLMDTIPVLIWCTDPAGAWVYFNKTWLDFTGRGHDEAIGRGWMVDLHPDDAATVEAAITMALQKCAPFRLEFRLRRRDGAWCWVVCSGVPRQDAVAGFAGFIGSCIDLTDMKLAEAQRQHDVDEKAAVMQELHHRVKNNAQVFASLLSVQASRAADPAVKAALRVAAARASTMAFAQQQIWDAGSSARFDLGALVRRLARAQQVHDVRIEVEAPATMFVPLATAVPLGLIVHELMTNAISHGYPDGGPGHVMVGLRRDQDGRLQVEVSDNGVGFGDGAGFEPGRSAGLTIVRSLARQLGASLQREQSDGTRMLLTLPREALG